MEILGIRLLGFNAVAGQKMLLTLALILIVVVVRGVGQRLIGRVTASGDRANRINFWARQGLSLLIAVVSVIGLV